MSVMICRYCEGWVDTDRDPDSLYVQEDEAVCRGCRDDRNLEPDFTPKHPYWRTRR